MILKQKSKLWQAGSCLAKQNLRVACVIECELEFNFFQALILTLKQSVFPSFDQGGGVKCRSFRASLMHLQGAWSLPSLTLYSNSIQFISAIAAFCSGIMQNYRLSCGLFLIMQQLYFYHVVSRLCV